MIACKPSLRRTEFRYCDIKNSDILSLSDWVHREFTPIEQFASHVSDFEPCFAGQNWFAIVNDTC